jgi:hypothetical protein
MNILFAMLKFDVLIPELQKQNGRHEKLKIPITFEWRGIEQ